MSRRTFLRWAATGSATLSLAACVAAPASAPQGDAAAAPDNAPTTVSFWHIWGGVRTEQLQQVLDGFTEANPGITVETLLLPNPGYADKIITGLAGDAPDLTMIYTDEFAPSAQRGALVDLGDYLAADGLDPDSWYPGVWNMTQVNGTTYGVPFVGNFLSMLYWNRDDFSAGGLEPEQGPENWDALINIAETLTTFDDSGNVENLGYVPGGYGEWMQATYRNGHDWLGDGTPDQVAIDNPLAQEAFQYVIDLYDAMGGWDMVGAVTEAWGNQQLGNPMIAGVASSILSGVFTVNIINDQAPDLNYKIGKVPHGPNGEFLDLIQASWNNAIPTRAQNPDAAWELAKYLSHGEGHLQFMVDLQGRPAMIKEYNEAPYDEAAREQNPYWDEVLEILNGTQVSVPVIAGLGSVNNVLREAFESVMLGQRTVEEALPWAQAEVINVLEDM